jgi:hypothetical protein
MTIADDEDLGLIAADVHRQRLAVEAELVASLMAWPWNVSCASRLAMLRPFGIGPDSIANDVLAGAVEMMEGFCDRPLWLVLGALRVELDRRGFDPRRVEQLAEKSPGPSGAPHYARQLVALSQREQGAHQAYELARGLLTGEHDPAGLLARSHQRPRFLLVRKRGGVA